MHGMNAYRFEGEWKNHQKVMCCLDVVVIAKTLGDAERELMRHMQSANAECEIKGVTVVGHMVLMRSNDNAG